MANKFIQDIKQNRKTAKTALVVGSVALFGVVIQTVLMILIILR